VVVQSQIVFAILAISEKREDHAPFQCVLRENIPVPQITSCVMQTHTVLVVINHAQKTAIVIMRLVTGSVLITDAITLGFGQGVHGGISSVGQALTFGKLVEPTVFVELLLLALTDVINAHITPTQLRGAST